MNKSKCNNSYQSEFIAIAVELLGDNSSHKKHTGLVHTEKYAWFNKLRGVMKVTK